MPDHYTVQANTLVATNRSIAERRIPMVGAEEFGAEVVLSEACGETGSVGGPVSGGCTAAGSLGVVELEVGVAEALSVVELAVGALVVKLSSVELAVGAYVVRLSSVELVVGALVDRLSSVELTVGGFVDRLSSVGLVVVSCVSTRSVGLGKAWIGSAVLVGGSCVSIGLGKVSIG